LLCKPGLDVRPPNRPSMVSAMREDGKPDYPGREADPIR